MSISEELIYMNTHEFTTIMQKETIYIYCQMKPKSSILGLFLKWSLVKKKITKISWASHKLYHGQVYFCMWSSGSMTIVYYFPYCLFY